ncbi:MAG: hypothetical protein O9325_03195 [Roseomonas sp.]|nr:hypothetical protein [Roseomonas sp.]
MRRYELATLVVAAGSAPHCGPPIAAFCAEPERAAGCSAASRWRSAR